MTYTHNFNDSFFTNLYQFVAIFEKIETQTFDC